MQIFFIHIKLITQIFSHFYYIFFRDRFFRERSNAIDGSNIASSAFWKKRMKNFLTTIRIFNRE